MTAEIIATKREKPIPFKGHEIRAILDGRKTQTRRVMKVQPDLVENNIPVQFTVDDMERGRMGKVIPCPFGKVGDQLWVRETWQHSNAPYGPYEDDCVVFYRADYLDDIHGPDGEKSPEGKYRFWKPSIHMPRHASRIQLEITNIRVERLQDISEEDAKAEGVDIDALLAAQDSYDTIADQNFTGRPTLLSAFRGIWESTGGDWSANPWVWVIEFKRVEVAA